MDFLMHSFWSEKRRQLHSFVEPLIGCRLVSHFAIQKLSSRRTGEPEGCCRGPKKFTEALRLATFLRLVVVLVQYLANDCAVLRLSVLDEAHLYFGLMEYYCAAS